MSLARRCVAELIGTFAIVFFGCGSMVTLHGQSGAHFMVNVVFGLTVAASIYALGHISAAHFNPAVTVGFAVAKKFAWKDVVPYVSAQFVGGLLASFLHSVLLGGSARTASFGATLPSGLAWISVVVEVVLTFFLMLVIISVATDERAHPAIPGLAIGMAVTLCGLFGGPISGCSMNPARSLAPAVFAGELDSVWIYFVGPVLGAILAVSLYSWIRKTD